MLYYSEIEGLYCFINLKQRGYNGLLLRNRRVIQLFSQKQKGLAAVCLRAVVSVVVDSLFIVASIDCGDSVFWPCFVMQY